MKKAGYNTDTIENYVRQAEMRFKNEYDQTKSTQQGRHPLLRGKRQRPSTSDSDSSDSMENNEFLLHADQARYDNH